MLAVPSGPAFCTISAAQSCGDHAASLQMPRNGRYRAGTESGSANRTVTCCWQNTRSVAGPRFGAFLAGGGGGSAGGAAAIGGGAGAGAGEGAAGGNGGSGSGS